METQVKGYRTLGGGGGGWVIRLLEEFHSTLVDVDVELGEGAVCQVWDRSWDLVGRWLGQ